MSEWLSHHAEQKHSVGDHYPPATADVNVLLSMFLMVPLQVKATEKPTGMLF